MMFPQDRSVFRGGNVRDMMSVKRWVPLVLAVGLGVHPVQAASPGAAVSGEVGVAEVSAPRPEVEIAPMSDPAIQGAACLGFAAASMAAVYAAGPMEALMLISGAQHVATTPLVLFIPMLSILGGGACALAAASVPSVSWMIDQSDNIADQLGSWASSSWQGGPPEGVQGPPVEGSDLGDHHKAAFIRRPQPIRPMTETEIQSTGCVVGALAGFGAAMVSSPMEVTMLASGATTVVSTTPLLGLGLLATVVGATCGVGSLAAIPVASFVNNFGTIGNGLFDSIGQ